MFCEGSSEVEKKELSFFKKIKTSIFDFEGYQDLAAEKVSKTIAYITLLILIFAILISIAYTFAPNSNNSSVAALLIPEAEPVITTVFPSYPNNFLNP